MVMKRREFILKLGAAALVLPSVVLKGCGGSSSDGDYFADDDDMLGTLFPRSKHITKEIYDTLEIYDKFD